MDMKESLTLIKCHSSLTLENRVDEALSSDKYDPGYATVLLGTEFLKVAERGNPDLLDAFLRGGPVLLDSLAAFLRWNPVVKNHAARA